MNKVYPVDFTQRAREDLIGVWLFVYNKSLDADFASEFCDDIENFCYNTLSHSPEIGAKRWHFGEELRFKAVGGTNKNYNLYYKFTGEEVQIVHIIRAGEDKENNL